MSAEQAARKAREGRFTYAEYMAWPDEERWELIEGEAFDMSPAPSTDHQRILGALHGRFWSFLGSGRCEVFLAPLDVRLPDGAQRQDEAIVSVVQPDLSVVCDPAKIDRRGCVGAPDLCVEILSPSTAYKDTSHKLTLYEKHGVREYWVVNPVRESVLVYLLGEDGLFGRPAEVRRGEVIEAAVLPGLSVALDEVFPRRRKPAPGDTARE